jgi:hypothetical protein
MTTIISDDDILKNLQLLKEKVDGINIKAKENIIAPSSEIQETDMTDIKNMFLYFLYFIYFCVPIVITGSFVYLLIHLKSSLIMTETKIDDIFTKSTIDEYKVIVISFTTFIVTCLLIFLLHKKFF